MDYISPLTGKEIYKLMQCCCWLLYEIMKNKKTKAFSIVTLAMLLHENYPDIIMEDCVGILNSMACQGTIAKDAEGRWRLVHTSKLVLYGKNIRVDLKSHHQKRNNTYLLMWGETARTLDGGT